MLKPENIDGTITCALEVKDLEKSIAWYTDSLGFEIIYKLEEVGWCEMKTPYKGITIGLSQVEAPQVKGGATITFGVKDIDALAKQFNESQIKLESDPYVVADMVKLVTFYDPDGNKFMLAQSLSSEQ
jgi:catechol 2,3-dioxygenase-like lactoylglutathione lyase family enzyme